MEPGDPTARQRLSKHVPTNTTIEAVFSVGPCFARCYVTRGTHISAQVGVTKIGHRLLGNGHVYHGVMS
jgi:hypothetical protein